MGILTPHKATDCRGCWKRTGTMICRRCNKLKYCSQECQKSHWLIHKQFCGKTYAELRCVWARLAVEMLEKGEDMVSMLHFVQHVGGDFWFTEKGENILHVLAGAPPFMQKFKSKRLRTDFELLLREAVSLGADVNGKCSTGDTPLHIAC